MGLRSSDRGDLARTVAASTSQGQTHEDSQLASTEVLLGDMPLSQAKYGESATHHCS